MKIVYVHHGNRKIGNPPSQNDDITSIGEMDAQLVGQLFEADGNDRQNFKAIYTSPIFRCRKTTDIINEKLNLPVVEDERLNELKSVPGETWVDLQIRVRECLHDIVDKYEKDDIVFCVTSGVNVVSFIQLVSKQKPSADAPFIGVPSCSPIVFNIDENCF